MPLWSTGIQTGTRAAQPTPNAKQAGTLYWVTDEEVLERWSGSAWTAYSAAPAAVGLASDRAARTSGDVGPASASWVDWDNGLDLTVAAVAGDVLLLNVSLRWGNEGVWSGMDAVTLVAGSPVNSVSGSGASDYGVTGWGGQSGTYTYAGTAVQYVVQAGDISSGTVTLRLRYRGDTAGAKTIAASANYPFQWSVVNLGQV